MQTIAFPFSAVIAYSGLYQVRNISLRQYTTLYKKRHNRMKRRSAAKRDAGFFMYAERDADDF